MCKTDTGRAERSGSSRGKHPVVAPAAVDSGVQCNRLLLFDGTLLHGVLPSHLRSRNGGASAAEVAAGTAGASEASSQFRITLMLGLWARSARASAAAGMRPGVATRYHGRAL